MRVRKMIEADLPRVALLLEELSTALGEDRPLDENDLRRHFANMDAQDETYENYVCEHEDEVIGFLSLLFYRSLYHRNGTVLINELIVSEKHRGRNAGASLLKYAVGRAREHSMDEIEVGVMQANERARSFYQRHGLSTEYLLLGMDFDTSS
ncbi:GNAT family N-acetyltransferase [Aminiphilus circumscriptus]|uniref:GNAT family N-acetyltransferase n=1 Tax=Aminiphilus circumscriptus TaxID=290732 RepID=UPI00054E7514|nr:GNAT family N-acetyltransferase [Aminiphilus circumscriptus]